MTELGYNHVYYDGPGSKCRICLNKENKHYEYCLRQMQEGVDISEIRRRLLETDRASSVHSMEHSYDSESSYKSGPLLDSLRDKSFKLPTVKEEDERIEPVDENVEGATMCPICCEYYLQKAMFSLSCKHEFCKNCMADHLRIKIVDG